MEPYVKKSVLVAEIERLIDSNKSLKTLDPTYYEGLVDSLNDVLSFLNTLEVKDHYEQCVQYDSIKAGIQAHAETYSFNIESELFHQLTKEQQELWRKEIEQACISGGDAGYSLAKDTRYKENLEVKEEILDKEGKTDLMRKCVHKAYKRGYDMGVLLTTNKINHNTKEVDLEKELNDYGYHYDYVSLASRKELVDFARHFYELGLKA